ncbi:MAG: N-acetylglucosamine-6-phosphate deacetylase, partial [Amnibacterium sp.]
MSATRLLTTDRLVTAAVDWAPAWIEVTGDTVSAAGHGERSGGEHVEGVLVPGFVDGHLHGALGHDFSSASLDEARIAAAFHHRSGSTSLVASIATAPLPAMVRQAALLAELVDDGTFAGLHLEGPFLSVERRGAHNPALLRAPDLDEADRLLEAGRGTIRLVTVAPELPGAEALIRRFVDAGVTVAIGHSACDAATAVAALDWGARMVTHTINGMPPIIGRAPGLAAVALADPRAHLEFNDDGQHHDPANVRL